MRAAFITLGCKVNQYETAVLERLFEADGFVLTPPEQEADVYVVNSCTVTATSDKKTRQTVRHCKRLHPGAVVALTGCFAQAFPAEAAALPEADVITGTANRAALLPAVRQALAGRGRVMDLVPHRPGEPFEPMQADRFPERTRAFVKIEDGCEQYCAYCIIPHARGPVRSKPLTELRTELAALAAAGHREVVLSGINLPCYGRDLGLRLLDAVQCAASVDGIDRVRLGSLEPELLSEREAEAMAACGKLCPQFHLSLQSGCDATLRRMGRRYTTAEYAGQAALLRRYFPGAALTTDVMVGFPGEDEAEFAASLAFVASLEFARVHVFAYSRRAGTPAAVLPGQVPAAEKNARSRRMLETVARSRQAFLQKQVGRVEPVLFESEQGGVWEGCTANYTPVRVESDEALAGRLLPVRIEAVRGDGCTGRLETDTRNTAIEI